MDKVLFSHNTDEYSTPQDLFNSLNKKYNFTLDPCSTNYNYKCDKHYTINDNGLVQSWYDEIVFCNPPYSNIKDWVDKCIYEYLNNNTKIVLLIPSRTDTKYFHKLLDLSKNHNIYVEFIKGRLKFNDLKTCAPFPSCIWYFGI